VRSTGWNGSTTLSRAIVSELLWWRRNVWYNTPFDFRARDLQAILTTNACKTGWGAKLVFGGRSFISYGSFWTEDDLTSSNQKETTAVLRALLYFHPMIIASNIRAIAVRTDNMVTVYNPLRQRASEGKLFQATRAIFSVLTKLDTWILMSHVPWTDNILTDALSRMDTAGDYELLPDVFRDRARALGSNPTIDLFASRYNHRLARFAALPGKSAGRAVVEDALMISWRGEIPYAFPPVQMGARVLQKLGRDGVASALVVVPAWPSQPWWNLLQGHAVAQRNLGDSIEILRRGLSLTAEHKLPPGRLLMVKLRFA
jgi:hypothetical protein